MFLSLILFVHQYICHGNGTFQITHLLLNILSTDIIIMDHKHVEKILPVVGFEDFVLDELPNLRRFSHNTMYFTDLLQNKSSAAATATL